MKQEGENRSLVGWVENKTKLGHVRSIANGCLKYWPLPSSDLATARMAVNISHAPHCHAVVFSGEGELRGSCIATSLHEMHTSTLAK